LTDLHMGIIVLGPGWVGVQSLPMESELEQDPSSQSNVRPVNRFLRFGLASITTLVLGGIILGIARATGMLVGVYERWFPAELALLVPFAPFVGIAAAAYPRRWLSFRRNAFIVAAIGAAVGSLFFCLSPGWMMLLGHLTFLRYVPLSSYLGWLYTSDFEFQTASCWIATGALAMLVTLTRRTSAVLIAMAVLCVLAVVLPSPVFNFVTNNQELTVAFVIPATPGASAAKPPRVVSTGPNWLDTAGVDAAEAHVLEALRKAGLPGPYRVAEVDRCGRGEKALQIIVLNPPVPAQALLPQPSGTELIYVSKPDGWRTVPAQAPTLGRNVEVRGPETGHAFLASYWIHAVASSGFGGAVWPD
jgi:hypothetical protein